MSALSPEEFDAFFVPGGALRGALVRDLAEPLGDNAPSSGTLLGRYRILQPLAAGGSAVVMLAERADGAYSERVAVKLLHGPGGAEIERRFARERHILSTVTHANIARLLDGGVDERHGPYIVMEYVDGQPIDRHCDERRLDVEARLEILRVACNAVAFAHRKLVVHRDIKPSNVFVRSDGEVKLLDFGIAKLLEPGAAWDTARTSRHPLTPEYAAPEQLRGAPVTTAIDVFQLGLLLYELLTGCRAHDVGRGALRDLVQAVCEQDPRPPSSVVDGPRPTAEQRARAAARGTTPAALRRRLSGDLDAIVMMALAKEPEARYASPDRLAADLARHLAGRPVMARRRTTFYSLGKFVYRHRVSVASATLALALAATGMGTTFWQARLAARETRRAAEVKQVLLSLFTRADPSTADDPDLTVRELLTRGVERVQRVDAEPALVAEVLSLAARCYHGLGLYRDALPLAQRAVALQGQLHGPRAAVTLEAEADLGMILYAAGRGAEAITHLSRALEPAAQTREVDERQQIEALTTLANALWDAGRTEEGISLLEQRLARARRIPGHGWAVALLASQLGKLKCARDAPAAERLLLEAVELEQDGARSSSTRPRALHDLGTLLCAHGRFDEAEVMMRRAVQVDERLLGPEHTLTVTGRGRLGVFMERNGDLDGAERAYRGALEHNRIARPPGHRILLEFAGLLGNLLVKRQRFEAAEPLLREAFLGLDARLDVEHGEWQDAGQAWMRCLTSLGQTRAAAALQRRLDNWPGTRAPRPETSAASDAPTPAAGVPAGVGTGSPRRPL
jgi:serine/threonine-protein kinase